MKKQIYRNNNYFIVPIQERDIILIKNWRNAQIEILRQRTLLTDEDQDNYYKKVILPSFQSKQPNIILFSYYKDNVCIGYGGLTNIDWESGRVELSFVLDNKRIENIDLYEKEFSCFIKLIKEVTFKDLNFNRIFTETYDIRPHHIKILENNGFILEGRMKQHVWINNSYVDSIIHGYVKEYYEA